MQAKLATAVLLGFVLVGAAACGGGSDQATIDELEGELVATEEALEEAQEAAAEAERQRMEAEAAAEAAEKEKADAEREAEEAETARQEAEEAEQEAEEARQTAETERQRLANEAEERRKADNAAATRRAIVGLNIGNDPVLTLAVDVDNLKYGAPAPVTTPTGSFTTTTSRSGQWSKTALTASSGEMRDMVEVYSDVEAPTSVPFKDSIYNDGSPPAVDAQGMVSATGVALTQNVNRTDVASGSFDRTSAAPKSFDMVDRGQYETTADRDAAIQTAQTNFDTTPSEENRVALAAARASRVRDTDRHPYRWTAEVSGTLGGASGRFRCGSAGSSADTDCTVQNTGGGFVFSDLWSFVPSSGTVGVRVNDSKHMWFGWWARQTVEHEEGNPTDDWAFEMGHGGNAVTTFDEATGTATYEGPAAGRYAVFEPVTGESSHGSFTASATLNANFGNATEQGTLSGTITGFSNASDWSLRLHSRPIASGAVEAVADTVTWSIGDVPNDSGQWEAAFYSNLPTGTTGLDRVQPHGIAGTFQARYDGSGVGATAAMIGAFGAHRPQ